MVTWVFRAIFVLLGGSVGYSVAQICRMDDVLKGILVGVLLALLVIVVEAISSRRPISSISAILFGLLIGFILARFFTEGVFLMLGPDAYKMVGTEIRQKRDEKGNWIIKHEPAVNEQDFRNAVSLGMTCIFCYLGVSIFYQTRDRFRFIIPYVEFRRAEQGPRPLVLDTSVIIDGRIADVVEAKLLEGTVVVPRFVLTELQGVADSDDRHKRSRGRRGLDVLDRLRHNSDIDVSIREAYEGGGKSVDMQLVDFARGIDARIATTDFNLSKIAQIQGIDVVNLNDLSNALKPMVLPGDELEVELIKPGEEPGQAVGYLPDGTMVVAEHARERIGTAATLVAHRVLQTTGGHLVFCKVKE